MLRILFSSCLVLFSCCLCVSAIAQEGMPQGQLVAVHEDAVIPSMLEKYEEAAKNLASQLATHNIASMTYTGASSQDFVYVYFAPVENMAALDKANAGFDELKKKMGDEAFQATMSQFEGCYNSHRDYLLRHFPDLSYKPEYGREIEDGMLFRHWGFYYVHPGKEMEAREIAKEWKALYESKDIEQGYRLYMGDMGTDMPLLLIAESAKSAEEYYSKSARINKIFGAEGEALLKKTWTVVRKFEQKDGFIRPDLSYFPTEDMTAK